MSGESQNSLEDYGKETEELQRQRDDECVMLRKQEKDEQFVKRQNMENTGELENGKTALVLANQEDPITKGCITSGTGEYDGAIQQAISDIFQEDESLKLMGLQLARQMLCRNTTPPREAVIAAGIVNKCVEFLNTKNKPIFQFEAAWVLTNVSSGTTAQTEVVIQSGAIPLLIEMLKSPHADLVDQSCSALGNCIGDGPRTRDMIIDLGVIPPLVDLVKTRTEVDILRNVAWVLSNVCRGKNPAPAFSATRMCLPALAQLVSSADLEIVSDSCWALSYLSFGDNYLIQKVIDAGVVPRLVELLVNPDDLVVIPSLRTLGNIVTGSDDQTQVVINAGVLPQLTKLLQHIKSSIVKDAAWTLSNIAFGTAEQVSLLMASGAVPVICKLLENGDFRIQEEAIYTVVNLIGGGTLDHIVTLCKYEVVPRLCGCLNLKDWCTVIKVMEALENILKAAEQIGQSQSVKSAIEECGGLDEIAGLQIDENDSVFKKAYSIIEQFFQE